MDQLFLLVVPLLNLINLINLKNADNSLIVYEITEVAIDLKIFLPLWNKPHSCVKAIFKESNFDRQRSQRSLNVKICCF